MSATRDDAYEDRFSRAGRWARRVLRPLRWGVKTLLSRRRHILLELRWRLGDELMALPVLAALRQEYPRDNVTLLTNYPELMQAAQVADAYNIAPEHVDRYINLRSGPRLVERRAHYTHLAGIPRPAGEVELDLGPPKGIASILPVGPGKAVVLAPGAGWPNKRWPRERWRDLAEALDQTGHRVVSLGLPGEDIEGEHLHLCGETSIMEAAQVLAWADAVVCCDSGLMHLAVTVGTPALALFGPTDPAFLCDSPLLHPIRNGLPCAGFWNHAASVLPAGQCACGKATCLESITTGEVLARLQEMLGARED